VTPKVKVALGVVHPGEVSSAFWISEKKVTIHELGRGEMPYYLLAMRCPADGLVKSRNDMVRSFLETPAEWLWCVDSDMGFPPDTLERLLLSADRMTRPVVGALCFGLRRESTDPDTQAERFRCFPTIYAWREYPDRVGFEVVTDYQRDQTVLVSASGAACFLVHRRVLEAIRDLYGETWFTKITHPVGPTEFGEDMSFFVKVAGCDFPVHVNTSVKTCHDKGGVFLDEAAWDRQQALDAPVAISAA
jgi:hypothetical protein